MSLLKKAKKTLKGIIKENPRLRPILFKYSLKKRQKEYMRFYHRYEVDDKLCVFEAFNGKKYCDSPKALYLEMLKDKKYEDYHFVWAFVEPDNFKYLEQNPRTTIVKYGSSEYKKTYAMAKYWITTSGLPYYLTPKDNQRYVQCWHGTPLKRLRYDIEVDGAILNSLSEIRSHNDLDARRFSYFLSPSAYCTEKFTSAFNLKGLGKDNIIVEKGYPRNDALFNFDDKYVASLKKKLNIPEDKKIILYAPTWRDDQYKAGVGYTYELGINFDEFQKRFDNEYIILFRTHYFVASSIDLSKYKGFIIDVSNYDDINDLYILADVLLTDYSSVFFDYANLHRPMLFYMYDLEAYKDSLRDFYISLDELPGPIVKTEEKLYNEISNIDTYYENYKEKYDKFNAKYNYLDDGDASARVLEDIIED